MTGYNSYNHYNRYRDQKEDKSHTGRDPNHTAATGVNKNVIANETEAISKRDCHVVPVTKRSIGTPRNDRGGLAREGGPARRSFSEGGYRSLPFFQQAEIIHDFTVEFCEKYIDKCFSGPYKNYNRHKSYKNFSRQSDQLIQAARSGKQNIAEGYLQKSSALKLNLLAVARASLEELLNDYQDFLRQKKLKIWAKDDPSAKAVRALVYKRYKNYNDYKKYQSSGETAANTMICLINQTNQLLDQKLRWLEEDFVKNGGFRENLLKKRLNYRREAGTASLALLVLFFLLAAIKIIIVITVISFIAARGNRACLAAGQSFSLSLSPPLLEVVLQPGKSITQAYEVKNLGTSLLYLQTEIRFFLPSEALAKEGQITYQEPDIFTGLPEFKLNNANINLGDTFVLEPNQSQQLVLKITAPLDLPQKDYYATFFIQQIPEVSFSEQQAQPGLAGQIGSNILITVSQTADLEAKGEISEFFSQPKLADLGQEIKFTIKAANLGENFFKSAGKIEIYNIFGKKIKEIELRPDNVLAFSGRLLTCQEKDCAFSSFFPGPYLAELSLAPNGNSPIIKFATRFWIVPIRLITALIIAFLIAVLLKYYPLTRKLKLGKNINKEI